MRGCIVKRGKNSWALVIELPRDAFQVFAYSAKVLARFSETLRNKAEASGR